MRIGPAQLLVIGGVVACLGMLIGLYLTSGDRETDEVTAVSAAPAARLTDPVDPSVAPASTPDASGTRTFAFAEGGFQIDLPASWRWVGPLRPSSHMGVAGAEGEFEVRTSVDGRFAAFCGSAACARQLPAETVEDAVGILRTEYLDRWVAVDNPTVERTPFTLDGAEAISIAIGTSDAPVGSPRAAPTARHVVFLHEGRLVIITWAARSGSRLGLYDVLESFRFSDRTATEPVSEPSYTDPVGAYTLALPPRWQVAEDDDPATTRLDGPATQPPMGPPPPDLSLTVRAGDSGGSISTCGLGLRGGCRTEQVTSTYELAGLFRSQPCERPPFPWSGRVDCQSVFWTQLADEPAIRMDHFWSGFNVLVQVRDGRPYVFSWQALPGSGAQPIADILASIRFGDDL